MNEIHTMKEIPECIRFKCLDETSSDDMDAYLEEEAQKRKEINRKNGIDDIVEDEQVCEKHGLQKGFTTIYLDGTKKFSCFVCKKEQKKEYERKMEELDNKVRADIERQKLHNHYAYLNVEPEYYDCEFDDYVPKSTTQEKAKKAVMKMVEEKHGKVVLMGPNGIGKTMLASIATKKLDGRIYTMYEISTMIRQSYTVKAERSELEIVKELASVPFLAIDELGRTKGSETELNWLSYILDKRHTRNLPFMLMTNGHFKSDCKEGGCSKCFENFIDNDILSRLRQDSTFVIITGPDERKNQNIGKVWKE